jgi:hypothetical protein
VDEDEIEALARRMPGDATREFARLEVAKRRWRERGQQRDHVQHLHAVVNAHHLVSPAVLSEPGTFVRFVVRAHE